MVFFNWDFENSRAEFERALELEPSSVSSLGLFGRYLSLVGDFDRAREVLERACTVDPLSPVPMMWRGWSSFMAREYGRSTRDFEAMLERFPDFPYALLWLGTSLVHVGETARAAALASRLEELTGFSNDHNLLAILGWTWARAGREDKTRRILDHFLGLSRRRWVDPAFIAAQYFALGQREETWAYLAQAFDVRSLLLAYLPTHPFLDGGRDDPRYAELLGNMKRVASAGQ
jgi:tetratricopeptide (TPR) repeat protein